MGNEVLAAFENAKFATKRGLYTACRSSSGFWRTESGTMSTDAEMASRGWEPVLKTIAPADPPDSPTWNQVAPIVSMKGSDFADGFNAALELLGVEIVDAKTVHSVTTSDTTVRGRPGTVAECSCGWRSAWGVRDGSAESDAHHHRMVHDEDYLSDHRARVAEHNAAERERGCTCKLFDDSFGFALDLDCPIHAPKSSGPAPVAAPAKAHSPCHSCSCHIHPPCGACENCRHYDNPDCPNDCQTCGDHDDDE